MNNPEAGWGIWNDWINLLSIQQDKHVLEISFKPGLAIQRISKMAVNVLGAGIDHSETMVQQAQHCNTQTIRDRRVELQHGSVLVLPHSENSFDKIFAINSIQFWLKPIENLWKVRRVLKPGGSTATALQPRWTKTENMVKIGEAILANLGKSEVCQLKLVSKPMQPMSAVCALGVK